MPPSNVPSFEIYTEVDDVEPSISPDRKKALTSCMASLNQISAQIAHDIALKEDIYELLRSPKSIMEIAYEKRYQNPDMLRMWLNKLAANGFLISEPGSDLFHTPQVFPDITNSHSTETFASDQEIFERMARMVATNFPAKLRNETGGMSITSKPHIWDSLTSLDFAEALREQIITQSRMAEQLAIKSARKEPIRVLDLGALTGNSTVTLSKYLPENAEITTVVHNSKYLQAAEYTIDFFDIPNAEVIIVPPLKPLTTKLTQKFDMVFIFHQIIYSTNHIADIAHLVKRNGSIAGFLPLREKMEDSIYFEWLWTVFQHFDRYPMQDVHRASLANNGFTAIKLEPSPLWTYSAIRA